MRSLTLAAVLIVVMLPMAAAAQVSDRNILVPGSSHPAANPKSYTQYEDVLDRIALYWEYVNRWDDAALFADRLAAEQKSYTQYEDVLDRIEAYQAELRKLRSAGDQKDIRSR